MQQNKVTFRVISLIYTVIIFSVSFFKKNHSQIRRPSSLSEAAVEMKHSHEEVHISQYYTTTEKRRDHSKGLS